jgi:hypothetical protein
MCVFIESNGISTLGPWARHFRLYLRMTRKEIAKIAKVNLKDIISLENNGSISKELRTKILKELYKIRVKNWDTLTNC